MHHADTARRMADAAGAFLEALADDQRRRAVLDFADTRERENWHYVPRPRQGLPLGEMDDRQRRLAHALVSTGASRAGYDKITAIIALEEVLAQIEGAGRRFARDPDLYYLSIFGEPGGEAPWGWRFEGHHISLNFALAGGELLGSTPFFLGANPAEVRHGERAGRRALAEEEDLARQLLRELDGDQKERAIISAEAPADILTTHAPHVRGQVRPEGLAGADMSPGQQQVLRALVEVYVGRLPEEVAAAEMARIATADMAAAHFAWAGSEERGGPHYYRVQSPAYLAEYDNTQNDANHIHAVWRDLRNDFGEDLLRRHYREGH